MSSVPRFFVPADALLGDLVTLPPNDAHHARSVLRLQPGEPIIVHLGDDTARACTLSEVSAKTVAAQVDRFVFLDTEAGTRITIAQALPKTSDKIEQVLQHGTEVGAAGFVLWASTYSVARLGDKTDKIDKRLERWRGIVKSAAEQSRRGVLPTVAWAGDAAGLAARLGHFDVVLVAHQAAQTPLGEALTALLPPAAENLLVIVGPEGGLTDSEVARFVDVGGTPISLGPRILRTETASLVALAQILFARG